jgi:hypothetical protein
VPTPSCHCPTKPRERNSTSSSFLPSFIPSLLSLLSSILSFYLFFLVITSYIQLYPFSQSIAKVLRQFLSQTTRVGGGGENKKQQLDFGQFQKNLLAFFEQPKDQKSGGGGAVMITELPLEAQKNVIELLYFLSPISVRLLQSLVGYCCAAKGNTPVPLLYLFSTHPKNLIICSFSPR